MNYIKSWFFRSQESVEPETEEEKAIKKLIASSEELSRLQTESNVRIRVHDCDPGVRACYRVDKREVWISSDIPDTVALTEAVHHELIHAFDHNVSHTPMDTIPGLCASEIRAMKRCECKNAWFRRRSTRNHAIEAVTLSIGDRKKATDAVDAVFDEIYDEDEPVYKQDEVIIGPCY